MKYDQIFMITRVNTVHDHVKLASWTGMQMKQTTFLVQFSLKYFPCL